MNSFKILQDNTSSCFELTLRDHPPCVSPVDVGTFVVRHLLEIAAKYLKHNQINSAVIAVPADFDAVQRRATVTAFEQAGLKVQRILDEPTAAAVAYGLHKDPDVTYVLVFDFGGGTLDVSLLYIRHGSVQVIGTDGDNRLGGEDLDLLLADYLKTEIQTQLGETIRSTDVAEINLNDKPGEEVQFPCTSAGIRRVAERVKRTLSLVENTMAECVVRHKTTKLDSHSTVSVQVSRSEFETLAQEVLERSLHPIRRVLADSMMSPSDVDEVVLVGGSSRIPWVHRKLEEMFNKRPHSHIDPDVAVAYGAAKIVD